ncbi:DUF6318 family protein [Jatrophihabitans fulvus]
MPTTGPNVRPGEKVPTLPAGADRNSRPGASQFALYWFQALDWGYATTSSALARQLYLPQCTDCGRFMKIFDLTRSKGLSLRGGRLSATSRQIVANDQRHPGSTVIDVTISQTAVRSVKPSGAVVERNKGVSGIRYRLWLTWTDNGWKVLDYKQAVA